MENQKFPHLMLDLETMGQGANAVICSIASVPFHLDGTTGDYFSQNVDIQSCLDAGLQVNGDTIYWWLENGQKARMSLLQHRKPLAQVLLNLVSFIGLEMEQDFKIWGKGPSFDMGILADAYRVCKINIPWRYSNERCVRTVIDGYEEYLKEYVPFTGIPHIAEADALHQVKQIVSVWRLKNDSGIMIRPDQDAFNTAMRDSLRQKMDSGICVSVLTVDRCPFCTDTCEAFQIKSQVPNATPDEE